VDTRHKAGHDEEKVSRPGMTKLDNLHCTDYIPITVSFEGAFMRRSELREADGASDRMSQMRSGADAGHRPARLGSPAGSTADGAMLRRVGIHEKRGPYLNKRRKQSAAERTRL
jgi:hypothetical protein